MQISLWSFSLETGFFDNLTDRGGDRSSEVVWRENQERQVPMLKNCIVEGVETWWYASHVKQILYFGKQTFHGH
jgi:hypothetical protein